MAITSIIVMLFALLLNVSLTNAVSGCTKSCWIKANARCVLDGLTAPCVCKGFDYWGWFLECNNDNCMNGQFEGFTHQMLCQSDDSVFPQVAEVEAKRAAEANIDQLVTAAPAQPQFDAAPTQVAHVARGWSNFCGFPGSFCLDGEESEYSVYITEPPQSSVTTVPEMARVARGWSNFCGFPGSFCLDDEDSDNPAPLTTPPPSSFTALPSKVAHTARGWSNFCGFPGSFCLDDEDAEDPSSITTPPPSSFTTIPSKVAHTARGWSNFCGFPGSFCLGEEDELDAAQGTESQPTSTIPMAPATLATYGMPPPTITPVPENSHELVSRNAMLDQAGQLEPRQGSGLPSHTVPIPTPSGTGQASATPSTGMALSMKDGWNAVGAVVCLACALMML